MSLNKYFDSIYVINLKKRGDRKIHIVEQLSKIQCNNYTLFEGVDGDLIDNPSKLKKGMYGLVKTYINIFDSWVKNKTSNIVIIEDDCIFSGNFNEELFTLMGDIPNDWEMIYFGGNHNLHVGSTQPKKINENIIKLHNTYSAHCVVLKDYVFEELVNRLKNLDIENDVFMSKLQNKYNAYSTSKKITWQLSGISNIEGADVNYDWLLK
jgi:GR25 family glycosyltransferase involved in LPS biosynthesis